MKHAKLFLGVLLGVGATVAVAQTAVPGEPAGKLPRLYKPYSMMTTLDPETVMKIDARHDETLAAIKALREAEYNDILAMLSDEQKSDLQAVEAQLEAERAEYIKQRQQRLLEERTSDGAAEESDDDAEAEAAE